LTIYEGTTADARLTSSFRDDILSRVEVIARARWAASEGRRRNPMRKNARLGEFEQLVLWTLVRLRDDAYGMSIRRALEKRTGKNVSIGAVYATLDRLESKGFVSSRQGEPLPERGGRARRYFRIEGRGAVALQEARDILTKAWRGVGPAEVRG
jgi:PadR family transcriptional regulator